MSIGASQDLVTVNIYGVTADIRPNHLPNWLTKACVVDLNDSVPASRNEHIRVIVEELGTEDAIGMAIKLNSIALHAAYKLPCELIVLVHSHIFACSNVLQPIARVVTSEQGVVLLALRVLKFTCEGIPVVDDAIDCHTQQRLAHIFLEEVSLDLYASWVDVGPVLDAASGAWLAALLGNIARVLIAAGRCQEKSNLPIGIT